MSSPRIRWAGPRALLIELDSLDSVLALHARLLAIVVLERAFPPETDDLLVDRQRRLLKVACLSA